MDETTRALRLRIEELERIEAACRRQTSLLEIILNGVPLHIFAKDEEGRFLFVNKHLCDLTGMSREAFLGKTDLEVFPAEFAEKFRADDAQTRARGEAFAYEESYVGSDGEARTLKAWKNVARRDDTGEVLVLGYSVDITASKRIEQELRDKIAVIEEQRRAIEQREAPVIRVWEGVLVMPLTGVMSVERGVGLAERVLHAVVRERARVILLDLTGVPSGSGETVEGLVRIAKAARLLGAHSMLVGMSPEVAQSLVTMGADLSEIDAAATLEQGLRVAFWRMGLAVVERT